MIPLVTLGGIDLNWPQPTTLIPSSLGCSLTLYTNARITVIWRAPWESNPLVSSVQALRHPNYYRHVECSHLDRALDYEKGLRARRGTAHRQSLLVYRSSFHLLAQAGCTAPGLIPLHGFPTLRLGMLLSQLHPILRIFSATKQARSSTVTKADGSSRRVSVRPNKSRVRRPSET